MQTRKAIQAKSARRSMFLNARSYFNDKSVPIQAKHDPDNVTTEVTMAALSFVPCMIVTRRMFSTTTNVHRPGLPPCIPQNTAITKNSKKSTAGMTEDVVIASSRSLRFGVVCLRGWLDDDAFMFVFSGFQGLFIWKRSEFASGI